MGIKPSYIGSHTVDGAGNAGLSVKHLQWRTAGERSQFIVAHPCSVHRISTSADQGSGTSKHKVNLNEELAASLNLLHWWCVKFGNYTAPITALENVHKEIGREKYKTIKSAVVTRWLSRHRETELANQTQKDLAIAINRLLSGSTLEKIHDVDDVDDDPPKKLPTDDDWLTFQQYEGAFRVLGMLLKFLQGSGVIVHEELMFTRCALEHLSAPFFTMYQNVSQGEGEDLARDLTVSVFRFSFLNLCPLPTLILFRYRNVHLTR